MLKKCKSSSALILRLFLHNCLLLCIACAFAHADILVLDDGSQLEGKARKVGDQWVVTDPTGHETSVAVERVTSFAFTGGPADTASDTAAGRLASLRQSVDHLSDLHQIIERYNNFLAAPNNAAAANDARADLAMWQRRLDDGYAKLGGRWLTQMERQELAATEAAAAADIGQLIRQGYIQQAQDALTRALADDPDDPAALYLQGLILAQQENVPAARADFEHVEKTVPRHAPTLNNLAAMLYRQHLYGAAMNAYSQAMLADPADKTVLDNVMEALHALPPEYLSTPPVKKAADLLAAQDKQLCDAQKANGLFRWGSGWVNAAELTKLTAEDQTIQSQLASLRGQYDQTEASIAHSDDQLRRTQQIWNSYNPTNSYNGNTTTASPLPQDYYQIQQDMNFLTAAHNEGVKQLQDLKDQIDRVENGYSIRKFSGLQDLIGPEGTPIRTDEAGPATQASPG